MKNQKLVQQQEDMRELALFMLFRTLQPTAKSPRYATYAHVARVLGLTYGQIHHLCRWAMRKSTKKPR